MSGNLQLVIYEGYLGDVPTMRYLPNGTPVTNFRIASTRVYKNKAEEVVKETTWLKVTAWGKRAEIVNEYCKKGSHVIVQGILKVNEKGAPDVYQLKTGEWASSYELTANLVRILPSVKKEDSNSEKEESPVDEELEQIPF